MSETITVPFPDISGDVTTYTAFLRNEAGTLLDAGGAAITEVAATGFWTFTLTGPRVAITDYMVSIYSGTTETAANLVFYDKLYAGQTLVGKQFSHSNLTVIRGTVGASPAPTTTTFTPSAVSVSGNVANQWSGRILIFDNDTTSAGLRGQATDITGTTEAALPVLTFTALSAAPASGDRFSIV